MATHPASRVVALPARIVLVPFLMAAAALPAIDASAQSPGASKRWEPISNPGFDPPIAGAADLVLDSARNRAYVYTQQTIWSLDLSTGTWSSFAPANHPPFDPALTNYVTERMVLDPVTDRLIMTHGGEDLFAQFFPGETWTLPLASPASWSRLVQSGPRNRTPVVIDLVRRRLLSFGGYLDAWRFNETRMLSLGAPTDWANIPMYPTLVYPRSGPAVALEASRGRLWMWGSDHYVPDEEPGTLWALDQVLNPQWRTIPTVRPAGTPTKGLISHDPVRDRLIHVDAAAGVWSLQIAPDRLSGTWSYTTSEADELPSGLPSAQVYDPVGDRLLVLVGTRVWALRLLLPEPGPEFVAKEEMFVRPRGTSGFAVRLVLAQELDARLDVYDVRGRRVTGVDAGRLSAGANELDVSLGGAAPGVYFVRATLGRGESIVRRVALAP